MERPVLMRARALIVVVLVVVATGCLRPGTFACAADVDCTRGGEQGACEAIGRCSFLDQTCASGRRFGELSGASSNRCVGEAVTDGGVPDAGEDGAPPTDAPPGDAPPGDAPPADAPSGCPAGYGALPGLASTHRYRRLPAAAGWTNQRAACGAEGANVYLAIPDDAAELAAILTLAEASAWVGISDAATEGVFVTVLGVPATFLPWAPGEPDNQGNQDCVRALSPAATFETLGCAIPAIAVCECAP